MRCLLAIALLATLATAAHGNPLGPDEVPGFKSRSVLSPRSRPPPEIATVGKQVTGAYACKGVRLGGDGSSTPLSAKLAIKIVLGGAWIEATLLDATGDPVFDDYRTYDNVANQWTRIQLARTTTHVIATSPGEQNSTWTWEGTATSPSGTQQVRDYEQLAGHQLKLWGEALLGGSWQKLYELTCKR